MISTLADFSNTCHIRLEKVFDTYLKKKSPALSLQEALCYTLSNGGKRIRPLLVYATGRAFNTPWENLDAPAAAIELIHTYSLIHDDLPAMDNAELRRGKPSCHKAYGEAMAILAGDALQPLAFEIIASYSAPLTPDQRLLMIQTLSQKSGLHGMVAGQALDIEGTSDLSTLTQMIELKTGALISTSILLGMYAGTEWHNSIKSRLEKFSTLLGLAFQMQDDLLDIETSSVISGKPQGLDDKNQKITLPSLMGKEKTQEKIKALFTQALDILTTFGNRAENLSMLTHYMIQRKK